jgi:hypothetical protein
MLTISRVVLIVALLVWVYQGSRVALVTLLALGAVRLELSGLAQRRADDEVGDFVRHRVEAVERLDP